MSLSRFNKIFSIVEDPRQEGKVEYKLIEVFFIAISSTIANGDGWTDMADFAVDNEEWLREYIELEKGLPCRDTFRRVFEAIDLSKFNEAFINYTSEVASKSKNRIIALDGKTSRGSHDGNKKAIHIVNAWLEENDLILGQLKTAEKSNEITAIPELLDLLFIDGAIITIDAMGTQKSIAKKIVSSNADYVLALKNNHKNFYEEVEIYFKSVIESKLNTNYSGTVTYDQGHGRTEKREYYLSDDFDFGRYKEEWIGLNSIGMVVRTILKNDVESKEVSYYITSLEVPENNCELFAKAVRSHWGVESCHWMLDVTFKEDASRIRKNNGAANMSLLKKMAMNILKNVDIGTRKMTMPRKRKKAGRNQEYLTQIISTL